MVLGVVDTFKDHRSLAHTLHDSEHIARKLGLIIFWLILFVLAVSASFIFSRGASYVASGSYLSRRWRGTAYTSSENFSGKGVSISPMAAWSARCSWRCR